MNEHNIEFEFHDYRRQGLNRAQLQALVSALGWEAMLNRRGTTWRSLPDAIKDHIDLESACEVMLDHPALIKRPILATELQLHLGFSAPQYQEIFS